MWQASFRLSEQQHARLWFTSRLKSDRISWDPAYDPKGRHRDNLDPWYMQVPCEFGTIYLYGGEHLAVEMDHHNQIAKHVAAFSGCELIQNGDFEKTVRFHVDQFDVVAQIDRPHRRPQISDERRQELREQMHKIRANIPENAPVSTAPTHSDTTA